MLVLRRKEGQWVTMTHGASGDTFRVRVYNIRGKLGQVDLAFDDDDRNFTINRPERVLPIDRKAELLAERDEIISSGTQGFGRGQRLSEINRQLESA